MRWKMLDGIESIKAGEEAKGYKCFSLSEDFFPDHFPMFPVVPGVLIIEALAQLSGKLIGLTVFEKKGHWPFPILSIIEKAKFYKFVRPGTRIDLLSSFGSLSEESAIMKVKAEVGGERVVSAEMAFVFNPEELEGEKVQEEVERHERIELAILWPGYREDKRK